MTAALALSETETDTAWVLAAFAVLLLLTLIGVLCGDEEPIGPEPDLPELPGHRVYRADALEHARRNRAPERGQIHYGHDVPGVPPRWQDGGPFVPFWALALRAELAGRPEAARGPVVTPLMSHVVGHRCVGLGLVLALTPLYGPPQRQEEA